MKLSPNWFTTHKRYSFWALVIVTALSAVWGALPAESIAKLPGWVVILMNGAVSAAGMIGSYVKQDSVSGGTEGGNG